MRCQEVRQMPDCRVAAETTLHTTVTGCNKQIADRRLVLLERQVNGAGVNAFISHFLSLTLSSVHDSLLPSSGRRRVTAAASAG
jgi:hypothetical protein